MRNNSKASAFLRDGCEFDEAPRGLHDLVPAAVVEGDPEVEALVVARLVDELGERGVLVVESALEGALAEGEAPRDGSRLSSTVWAPPIRRTRFTKPAEG